MHTEREVVREREGERERERMAGGRERDRDRNIPTGSWTCPWISIETPLF